MRVLFLIILIALVLVLIVLGCVVWQKRRHTGKTSRGSQILRHSENPLIGPDKEEWRSQGTFNPAAVMDSKGRVHLLYRAVGGDGISRLSYASSADGARIDDLLPYPIFAMEDPKAANGTLAVRAFDPVMYPSGGSCGGAEDPRMVSIDGTIYVTFNAFDGWDYLRVGLTSMKEEDFFAKRFKWAKPELISPKGQIHKNWVLFPEKINGKFAILHSITPTVLIDYVDRLEDITKGTKVIQSREGPPQGGRKNSWDNRVRSAGPPPIKTDRGWLVLYHAVDNKEPHKYKLGGMLLDLKDPTKVIARSPAPLLEPDMWYENDWKPGIVYACGAVVKKGELYVYYGGVDKHVCAARAPLRELLDSMKKCSQ